MHYEVIILSGGIEGYATALLAQFYGLKTAFVCVDDATPPNERLDTDLSLPTAVFKILDLLGFSSHSDKKIQVAHLAAFLQQRLIHNKQIALYEKVKSAYLTLHEQPKLNPDLLPTVSLSYTDIDTNKTLWQISSNFLIVGKVRSEFLTQQIFNPQPYVISTFNRPYIRYQPNNAKIAEFIRPAVIARRWLYGCSFLLSQAAYQLPALITAKLAHSTDDNRTDNKYSYSLNSATYTIFAALQDAQNLLWKIFLVVNQRANTNLLLSYQGERWPIVSKQLKLITDILEYKCSQGKKYSFLSNLFTKSPQVLSQEPEKLSCGITANAVHLLAKYNYQSSNLWGSLLPSIPVLGENGLTLQLDKLQMAGFLLIGWDKNPVDWLNVADIHFLAGLRAAFLQIIPNHQPFNAQIRHTTTAKDTIPNKQLTAKNQKFNSWQQWFTLYKANFVLVRPDRLIFGTANTMQELGELMQQLRLKLGYQPIVWADLGEEIYDWAEKAQVDL